MQVQEALDPAQVFEASLIARHKTLREVTSRGDSSVQQFYRDATVFVTGGSGFLGKQLIEKLFRATNISKVFLLMRMKKGKPIKQRISEMLEDPVYDILKVEQPGFVDKIVPVEGDVAELRLGMSDEDWKTVTEQTDIIFHMAATTRFDEVLRVATFINVRGTRETLLLAKECSKLRSFVHVSTAYSHAKDNFIKTDVLEEFYPSPVDPEALIRMAETVEEGTLNDITRKLIKGWPNTYSFAKAVAEELVRNVGEDLPVCVVRPAIVVCAYREPHPGWLDLSCVYGATGIILGSGLGLMHVIYANDETKIGLIPVDYVNNAIITAGYETARRRGRGARDTKIYTVVSSTRTDSVWGNLRKLFDGKPLLCKSPVAVWYNFWFHTSNATMFWLLTWLIHLIPAYIVDNICAVFGKERRFVRLYKKMGNMSKALSYFTLNYWNFQDKNLENLYNSLSPVDKEIFNFDIDNMDWKEYLLTWSIGVRKYIVKDGLKGTYYAVNKQRVFRILHYILSFLYIYGLYKVVYYSFTLLSLFFKLFL
ncbi:fatty acyl-CoA reductase wat-like [Anticarsia gemmatalis]|uniref:fatty acyl-CoA reductase wat-like n=1 Tax=Anticarsia gemmatalis TaxID=129554 RepID=UPI003F762248